MVILGGSAVYQTPDPALSICSQSLVSNIAFGLGASVFAAYEQTGEGVHWYNIDLPANADELVTMSMCIRMLWLDAAIYAVFTWYIEAVFPGGWLTSGCIAASGLGKREFQIT